MGIAPLHELDGSALVIVVKINSAQVMFLENAQFFSCTNFFSQGSLLSTVQVGHTNLNRSQVRYVCVVAVVRNIRSCAPARKSTSIANKPSLAMLIGCTSCAIFIDKTTESLSSLALIDVDHCCCFARSRE